MGGMRRVVRATVLAVVVLAGLAGSVQAVTMLAGMPSASQQLKAAVRGYPSGGAGAWEEHVGGAAWDAQTADRETFVLAIGGKGAGTVWFDRGSGLVFAATLACENGDIIEHDVFSGDAAYTGKSLSSAKIVGGHPETFDLRVPNCDNPDWDHEVDSEGSLASDVTVDLTGQGKRTPIVETSHQTDFPACLYGDAVAGLSRDAAARLTFPAAGDLGFDLSGLRSLGGALVFDSGAGADGEVGNCFGFSTSALHSHSRAAHRRVARAFAHRFARTR